MGFVGAVIDPIDSDRSALFGACFAMLDREHFVTADHVVGAAIGEDVQRYDGPERRTPARDLHVMGPGLWPVRVERAHRHPTADVAVLYAPHDAAVEPFTETATPEVDQAVRLHGSQGPDERLITTITGFRRYVDRALARYGYDALELAAAGGRSYSGTAVLTHDGERVLGVSTGAMRMGSLERGVAVHGVPMAWLAAVINDDTEGCGA